ncbi:hypothetical protein E4U31_002368 [Claviceps sp. LM219 group G6]|nr:hypothetical protein E4U31_002368 [Claviceps sp. LM219 group G6]
MFAEKYMARMLLWRKKVAGLARVETAWDEQKARVGRTAKQIDSKSSPSEKPVPSSTHLLRLVSDALDPQAEDLKPWTKFESPVWTPRRVSESRLPSNWQHETDVELAAVFFSENLTVAAAQEPLKGSPEQNIVEESPPDIMSRASLPLCSHCFHGSAGDAKFESTEKIEKDTSRAVMIQGDSRSRETRSFMTTVYRWVSCWLYALGPRFAKIPKTFDLSIQGTASIFMCAIRKIHDMGHTSLVAGRQIPSMPARLLTNNHERRGVFGRSNTTPFSHSNVNRHCRLCRKAGQVGGHQLGSKSRIYRSRNLLICCPHVARCLSRMPLPSPLIDDHAMCLLFGHGMALTNDKIASRSNGAGETRHWQGVGRHDAIGKRALLQFVIL